MNALIVTLRSERPLRLPIAYNQFVQGALDALWREALSALPNADDSRHAFRLYTFSPLLGRYSIEGKEIIFSGVIRLEIRSPSADFIKELAARMIENGSIRLGTRDLTITDMQSADKLLFYPSARIRTLAPVTVYENTTDGEDIYYAPMDGKFAELLEANLATKLRTTGTNAAPSLKFRLTRKPPRQNVTTFKGSRITGYTGEFLLETDPASMKLLYYTGLGTRNSQGFGMFNIEEQNLK